MASKKKRWTDEEFLILDKSFNKEKKEVVDELPGRTWRAISNKIRERNLPRDGSYKRYTKKEDDILKNNYHLPENELKELMNGRSWTSIIQRCEHLNLDRSRKWSLWSKEEESVLREVENVEQAIALLPGRNYNMIVSKARKMNISIKTKEYWSEEEDIYLIENYEKIEDIKTICETLDRTTASIYTRANRLNLNRGNEDKELDDSEVVAEYKKGLSITEISKKMNKSYHTIKKRLNQNNIYPEKIILLGENSPAWKGGLTSENVILRGRSEYREWREEVYKRDCYTCQRCGDNSGGNLHAHHIRNFSDNVEIRYELDNGITLCNSCHMIGPDSYHMKYGTKNNNPDELKEHLESYAVEEM